MPNRLWKFSFEKRHENRKSFIDVDACQVEKQSNVSLHNEEEILQN